MKRKIRTRQEELFAKHFKSVNFTLPDYNRLAFNIGSLEELKTNLFKPNSSYCIENIIELQHILKMGQFHIT